MEVMIIFVLALMAMVEVVDQDIMVEVGQREGSKRWK